ncbi:hypothetical protein [Staphylococcus kloosii]|jgi:RNase H-fold protein (predicted Holliday junction resolvase)|uniref:hypothetical protein n=1 Tax=Staphylococcus kloosii TaxID=29384 RepID=UPI0018A0DF58|nr:hypothetical protein [Staphylococcus kloosii]MBF7028881.1 hypothetical protein [Staphylococcus kloosii]
MFKTLKEMKRKDDIEFKEFSNEVNYQLKKFEKENDEKLQSLNNQRKLQSLNNQRKLQNKRKHQSSLWAEAIKNGKF